MVPTVLLAGMVVCFRFHQHDLALVPGFIGVKMIVEEAFHDFHLISEDAGIFVWLGVILVVLAGSIALSLRLLEKKNRADAAEGV